MTSQRRACQNNLRDQDGSINPHLPGSINLKQMAQLT